LDKEAVVDLICFHPTKYSLPEFLGVKNNIISGDKCAGSDQEICLQVETNEI